MKADKLNLVLIILTVFCGAVSVSTGNIIIGGIILLLGFGMYWNRGSGPANERIIFENEVKTELGIAEIYERIKDMDSPLGKAWIAEHTGYEGDSIVYGPSPYKDCVVISKKAGKLSIKHITKLGNIERGAYDEYRFENLIDAAETAVTPESYSKFAKYKLLSVMMIRHLRIMIEDIAKDPAATVPAETDMVNFYYHNSGEGWYKDEEGRDILRAELVYNPLTAKLFNSDGEEMAAVVARKLDRRSRVSAEAGFDIYANGRSYGEMYPFKTRTDSGFTVKTEDGEFLLKLFPSCTRANVSCNYRVEKDGVLKAVIGGSPRLLFNENEQRQNDLVLSYDDDYLVLYAVLELFVMTLNSSFLKY